MIAVELAHLRYRHALTHYEASVENTKRSGPVLPNALRYFGPGGIFNYSDEENGDAVEAAVGILYRAGFDPRGLVGLLEKLRINRPNRLMIRRRSDVSWTEPVRPWRCTVRCETRS